MDGYFSNVFCSPLYALLYALLRSILPFQVKKLVEMDMTLKKQSKPQILIFHTHGASEAFINSRAGKKELQL